MVVEILLLSRRVTSTTPSCTTAATAIKPWVWGDITCSSLIFLPSQSTWSCVALFLSSGRCIMAIYFSFLFFPWVLFLTGTCSALFVLYSMAKSFKKNYVLSNPASSSAWQILCSWDFSIINERAITQRKNNLSVQLKVRSFKSVTSGVQGEVFLLLILLSLIWFYDCICLLSVSFFILSVLSPSSSPPLPSQLSAGQFLFVSMVLLEVSSC